MALPAKGATPAISGKVKIAGPPSIGVMRRGCSGWRSKKASRGARYHGVGEEGIPFRSIAEVIGRNLNVPVGSISSKEAKKQFSYFGGFAATDNPTSSARTRDQLGWEPTGPRLLVDLDGPEYFATK